MQAEFTIKRAKLPLTIILVITGYFIKLLYRGSDRINLPVWLISCLLDVINSLEAYA